MKKTLLLLTFIFMLFLAIGCGTEEVPTPKSVTTSPDAAAAKVSVNEEVTYFTNAADAWSFANASTNEDCEMTLLKDWIAEDGVFGTGSGYGSTGNLTPIDRKKDTIKLTIDLNGFTLDRNLDNKVTSGNIISFKKDGVFTVKNGTLTGGNTKDRGGALWLDNNETTVYLDNLTITGNYADGNGGAIFIKTCDIKVYFNDVTIKDNVTNNYGGAIYIQGSRTFRKSQFVFSGVDYIFENDGKDNRDNITYQSGWKNIYITDVSGLEEGSKIYVAPSDFSDSLIVKQAKSTDKTSLEVIAQYFHSDNTGTYVNYSVNDENAELLSLKWY